jgi:hypothetical protein
MMAWQTHPASLLLLGALPPPQEKPPGEARGTCRGQAGSSQLRQKLSSYVMHLPPGTLQPDTTVQTLHALAWPWRTPQSSLGRACRDRPSLCVQKLHPSKDWIVISITQFKIPHSLVKPFSSRVSYNFTLLQNFI